MTLAGSKSWGLNGLSHPGGSGDTNNHRSKCKTVTPAVPGEELTGRGGYGGWEWGRNSCGDWCEKRLGNVKDGEARVHGGDRGGEMKGKGRGRRGRGKEGEGGRGEGERGRGRRREGGGGEGGKRTRRGRRN